MKPSRLNSLIEPASLEALLNAQIAEIQKHKESIVGTLRMKVDAYWDWFNGQNTKISNLRKVGSTELSTSNVAPVIEIKRSGDADEGTLNENVYVVWKSHNPRYRENLRKHTGSNVAPSKPLHTYTSKNIKNILTKRCTWDTERALELESEFEMYRAALIGLHQAHVRLRAAKRSLNKLGTQVQHNEEISHAS